MSNGTPAWNWLLSGVHTNPRTGGVDEWYERLIKARIATIEELGISGASMLQPLLEFGLDEAAWEAAPTHGVYSFSGFLDRSVGTMLGTVDGNPYGSATQPAPNAGLSYIQLRDKLAWRTTSGDTTYWLTDTAASDTRHQFCPRSLEAQEMVLWTYFHSGWSPFVAMDEAKFKAVTRYFIRDIWPPHFYLMSTYGTTEPNSGSWDPSRYACDNPNHAHDYPATRAGMHEAVAHLFKAFLDRFGQFGALYHGNQYNYNGLDALTREWSANTYAYGGRDQIFALDGFWFEAGIDGSGYFPTAGSAVGPASGSDACAAARARDAIATDYGWPDAKIEACVHTANAAKLGAVCQAYTLNDLRLLRGRALSKGIGMHTEFGGYGDTDPVCGWRYNQTFQEVGTSPYLLLLAFITAMEHRSGIPLAERTYTEYSGTGDYSSTKDGDPWSAYGPAGIYVRSTDAIKTFCCPILSSFAIPVPSGKTMATVHICDAVPEDNIGDGPIYTRANFLPGSAATAEWEESGGLLSYLGSHLGSAYVVTWEDEVVPNTAPLQPTIELGMYRGGVWYPRENGRFDSREIVYARATSTDPDLPDTEFGTFWITIRFETQWGDLIQTETFGPFTEETTAEDSLRNGYVGTYVCVSYAADASLQSPTQTAAIYITQADTLPPAQPLRPTGPTELIAGESGTYLTTTTDNSGYWHIRFRWRYEGETNWNYEAWQGPDGTTSTWYANGDTASMALSFPTNGIVLLSALARDRSGNQSTASENLGVQIGPPPDTTPPTTPPFPWVHGLAYANAPVLLTSTSTDDRGYFALKMAVEFVGLPAWDTETAYGDFAPSGREVDVRVVLPDQHGQYQARARAVDPAGNESGWSDWATFNAVDPDPDYPTIPTTPELIDGMLEPGTFARFGSVAYIGGGYQYQMRWDVTGTFTAWGTAHDSGEQAMYLVRSMPLGSFHIRAQARNASYTNRQSDWSDAFTAVLTDPGPETPTRPIALDPLRVGENCRFRTQSFDNRGGYYILWKVDGVEEASWTEWIPNDAGGHTKTISLEPGALRLQAKAKDSLGQESDWSQQATFLVGVRDVPPKPRIKRFWIDFREILRR